MTRNPAFIRRLIALDVAPLLTPEDFYKLDDHMNARGHDVVAGALAEQIANSRRSSRADNGGAASVLLVSWPDAVDRSFRAHPDGTSARSEATPAGREWP